MNTHPNVLNRYWPFRYCNDNTAVDPVDPVDPIDDILDPPVILYPVNQSTLNDPNPIIKGTSEPNAVVEVFVDGNLIGTVTANAEGFWVLPTPSGVFANEGCYIIRADQTIGGETSEKSEPVLVCIEESQGDTMILWEDGTGLLDEDGNGILWQ